VDEAFLWIGGICIVLLVGITVTMILFVFKYRRSRNPKAVQIEGSLPLELTWIVIPTILVLFMFYKGYEGFKLMRNVPEGAMEVNVLARKWFWTFTYPGTGVSSDKLYVPVETPVKLLLDAPPDDVVHSFYLPAFRVKEDCVPGKTNYLWFQAEKTGIYHIFCAEFCGKDHSKMITELVVLEPKEYEAWLKKKVADRNRPVVMEKAVDPASEEIAERDGPGLYKTYCVSCHGERGQGGLVEDARDFTSLEKWKKGSGIADIFRTLTEGLPETQMRSFANLPPWDRFALVHMVRSFYNGADRPENTPDQLEKLRADYELDKKRIERKAMPIEDAIKAIAVDGEKSGDGKESGNGK